MKKRITALVLALLMLATAAGAYSETDQNTADALNYLGLFLGTGKGYELDAPLTRAQGITLLVRMVGGEDTAEKTPYTAPFTDLPDWAKPHVGYAYANGITNGVSATAFGPNREMTDAMFLTLVLRAMGYSDQGSQPLYTWDKPYAVAKQVGLTVSDSADAAFTRADAIRVFWNAMNSLLAEETKTLAQRLMEQGVFDEGQYQDAVQIQAVGLLGEEPSEPEPEEPAEPETPAEPEPPVEPEPPAEPEGLTYAQYMALSGAEKRAYRATFATTEDFFAWYHAALAAHEAEKPGVEMGPDGTIDLGGLNGGN